MGFTGFLALAVAFLGAGTARASVISFQGSFTHDDDVQYFSFSLLSAGSIDLLTWSYGGGVNGVGDTIAAGGFDPYLSVFDLGGLQLLTAVNDNGACPPLHAANGNCFDSELSIPLPAGNYILALTESGNFPNGPTLADGFSASGTGDFTGGPFLDIFANQQDGHWALDFGQVDSAAVITPEPHWLAAAGLLLLLAGRRQRPR